MAQTNSSQIHQPTVAIQPLARPDEARATKEARERRAERERTQSFGVDTVEISQDSSVASSGEVSSPSHACGTGSVQIKEARLALQALLKKSGNKNSSDLISAAEDRLQDLEGQIQKSKDDGQDPSLLLAERDQVQKALIAYQATLVADIAPAPEAVQNSPELDQAWKSLEAEIAGLGIDISAHDLDRAHEDIKAYFTDTTKKYAQRTQEINARLKEIAESLKTASPQDKQKLEEEAKNLKLELTQIAAKTVELKQAAQRVSGLLDTIQRAAIANDLGSYKTEKPVNSQATTTRVKTKSVKTASKPATLSTGSQETAQTVSERPVTAIQTASQENEEASESSGGSSAVSTLAIQSGSDFSGTTLAIQSTGSKLKADARKTEEAIKKLLRAALAGDMEAVSQALILMDKRAGQILTGMGATTIKAMQGYEKGMDAINKSISKLTGKEADYNSKLAGLNSKMNQYSMNRQAITNFLQSTLSMREEIGNTTHGFISKMGQISSSLSRFG